jgi:hypothetical protein
VTVVPGFTGRTTQKQNGCVGPAFTLEALEEDPSTMNANLAKYCSHPIRSQSMCEIVDKKAGTLLQSLHSPSVPLRRRLPIPPSRAVHQSNSTSQIRTAPDKATVGDGQPLHLVVAYVERRHTLSPLICTCAGSRLRLSHGSPRWSCINPLAYLGTIVQTSSVWSYSAEQTALHATLDVKIPVKPANTTGYRPIMR